MPKKRIRWRDLAERVFWTFVTGAGTQAFGSAVLDIDEWKSAVLAGVNALGSMLLVVGRQRLAALPDPGAGLPGFPTKE